MTTEHTLSTLVTAMTTNLTAGSIYSVYEALLPWIGGIAVASLTIYVVRKLIKKFTKGKAN